jgi:hypothetical protein
MSAFTLLFRCFPARSGNQQMRIPEADHCQAAVGRL